MNKVMNIFLAVCLSFVSADCFSKSEMESISPELRELFKQEMLAIQSGMQKMVVALASGDFEELAHIAGNIKHSFILKQEMTDIQKHELHEKLPAGFLEKDQQFHKYAGMLQHVSEKQHTELVSFYYSKLLDSCVSCHSLYADHRFSNFKKAPINKAHQH